MLIGNEGHRNPMSRAQLRERMKGWIGGDYHAAIFSSAEGKDLANALWADQPE